MECTLYQPRLLIASMIECGGFHESVAHLQIEVMLNFGKSCFIWAIWWEVIDPLEKIILLR